MRLRVESGLASVSKVFFCLVLLALLTACAVGPDYVAPPPAAPASWGSPTDGVRSEQTEAGAWWHQLGDEKLESLIARAKTSNLSLREAMWRVEEVWARYQSAVGTFYPQVNAQGGVSRMGFSHNAMPPNGMLTTDYSAGLGLSWELDLFGRVRRSIESAKASVEASEEARRGVMVALYSEIAQSYIALRVSQARLSVSKDNLESQQKTAELTKARRDSGLASDLDLAQAETSVAETRTVLPQVESAIAQGIHRLSILLGEEPRKLWEELVVPQAIPQTPQALFVDMPVDIIRHRPDIRAAERALAAQTAIVGVASSELYPSFTLAGSFGYESFNSGELFKVGSQHFTFGPSFNWPILSFGRVRNAIKAEEAAVQEALAKYEQTVLNGLAEVEDALSSYQRQKEKREALKDAVATTTRALNLSTELYTSGLVNFQNVLDAQRSVLRFQNEFAITDGAVAQSYVAIYTALGGAWWIADEPVKHEDGVLGQVVQAVSP